MPSGCDDYSYSWWLQLMDIGGARQCPWSPLFLLFIVREYFAEANKSNADRKIILSGSFNPLHDVTLSSWMLLPEFGYTAFISSTLSLCSICGRDGYPCFEISAVNADKPPLTVSQIKERVKQFERVGEAD
ncbi:hypothetical protein CK203_070771 [Vitis vinifera]|uniref:Uncharacterized protein n=1 Tax=Vitis vinifera TaxID=29760 RepID=A0A438C1B7_VITVI|nr:hypothetical protein CK203_070771 [Vitis vinifera]